HHTNVWPRARSPPAPAAHRQPTRPADGATHGAIKPADAPVYRRAQPSPGDRPVRHTATDRTLWPSDQSCARPESLIWPASGYGTAGAAPRDRTTAMAVPLRGGGAADERDTRRLCGACLHSGSAGGVALRGERVAAAERGDGPAGRRRAIIIR